MKKLKNFEEINNYILKFIVDNKVIPNYTDISQDKLMPSMYYMDNLYKKNVGVTLSRYYREQGYKSSKEMSVNNKKYNYDDLFVLWESFYNKHKRYPMKEDCNTNGDLPYWYQVKRLCGEKFNEFHQYFKDKEIRIIYDQYCKLYIEECNKRGKHITGEELDAKNELSDILPSQKWFIENSPYEIKTYKDFVKSLGFKYKDELTKEEVVMIIKDKQEKLNRNLKAEDFDGIPYSNQYDIGIGIIIKHWGTFNNMLEELGFPINIEDMTSKHKEITDLKKDVINLCNDIYINENRKIIHSDDFENNDDYLSYQTYSRRFRKELHTTLSDFLESIGFELTSAGMGMVYKFDDGEITTSKYEYDFSLFLKNNNIQYIRNVKYRDFISGYEGNKDCDYLIIHNDIEYYIEIAGILGKYNSLEHAQKCSLGSIQIDYLNKMYEKERMLKENKLNYLFLFKHELADFDIIFDFLKINNTYNQRIS